MTRRLHACVLSVLALGLLRGDAGFAQQEPSQPQAVSSADLKAAIMKLPMSDRTYMVKEMLAYIGQFRGYSWVKPILSASAKRLFLGRY